MFVFRLTTLLILVGILPAYAWESTAYLWAEAQCLSDEERDEFLDGLRSEQVLAHSRLADVFLAETAFEAGRRMRSFLASPERPSDLRELLRRVGKRGWVAEPQLLGSLEAADCWISFVFQPGPDLVVKQVIDPGAAEQRLVVIDAAAHRIAEYAQIPCNRVKISPQDTAFPGKVRPERAASVHSLAAGSSCEESLPWEGFTMHQRAPLDPNVPTRQRGLRPAIVATMARHASLPRIAALDTFVGNADRSLPNLFYSPEDSRFTGIDLAAAFNRSLARDAIPHIQRILNYEWRLSPQETRALQIYSMQLRRLVEDFPPHVVEALLLNSLLYAGLWDMDDELIECYKHHSRIFQENYAYCQQLLGLLEKI